MLSDDETCEGCGHMGSDCHCDDAVEGYECPACGYTPTKQELDNGVCPQCWSLGRADPYPPGTRVIRQNTPDAHEPDPPKEYGVVVHSWWDGFLGTHDYYVAFFGESGFPTGPVSRKPYVLRYLHTSLRRAPC